MAPGKMEEQTRVPWRAQRMKTLSFCFAMEGLPRDRVFRPRKSKEKNDDDDDVRFDSTRPPKHRELSWVRKERVRRKGKENKNKIWERAA